jgi:hypothetical protein
VDGGRASNTGISQFPTIPAKLLSKHSRCQDDIRTRDMPTTRRQCCPVLPPGSTERLEQQTFILKLNLDNFLGLHMHPGDIGGDTTESYVQFYRYMFGGRLACGQCLRCCHCTGTGRSRTPDLWSGVAVCRPHQPVTVIHKHPPGLTSPLRTYNPRHSRSVKLNWV